MARLLAIVRALTGRISPVPSWPAATVGLQPVAWAPYSFVFGPSIQPRSASSSKALPIFVKSDPPAMQHTRLATLPVGLFGDFKAHGLGTLAVERTQIDVDDP